jgi:hypothetical protein
MRTGQEGLGCLSADLSAETAKVLQDVQATHRPHHKKNKGSVKYAGYLVILQVKWDSCHAACPREYVTIISYGSDRGDDYD